MFSGFGGFGGGTAATSAAPPNGGGNAFGMFDFLKKPTDPPKAPEETKTTVSLDCMILRSGSIEIPLQTDSSTSSSGNGATKDPDDKVQKPLGFSGFSGFSGTLLDKGKSAHMDMQVSQK